MAGVPDPNSLAVLLGLNAARTPIKPKPPGGGQSIQAFAGAVDQADTAHGVRRGQGTVATVGQGREGGGPLPASAEDQRWQLNEERLSQAKLDPNAPRGSYLNIVV